MKSEEETLKSWFCYLLAVLLLFSCEVLSDTTDCSTPDFRVLHYLLEFAQTHDTESMMPYNHLIFCCPLLLLNEGLFQ